MRFEESALPGVWLIHPEVYGDERGELFESFRDDLFRKTIGEIDFVQENESTSVRGVLRGLHYQMTPHAQAKLVRVIEGEVLDVAVDIRRGSPTFGRYVAVRLSGENRTQLFLPGGFAHGFLVLSQRALFQYKVDAYWHRDSERAIRYDDPEIGIEWPLPKSELILSDKDLDAPSLSEADLPDYESPK